MKNTFNVFAINCSEPNDFHFRLYEGFKHPIFSWATYSSSVGGDDVVVVAQLVEQLLPTPESDGSNPITSNFYFLSTVLKRRITKEKRDTLLSGIKLM